MESFFARFVPRAPCWPSQRWFLPRCWWKSKRMRSCRTGTEQNGGSRSESRTSAIIICDLRGWPLAAAFFAGNFLLGRFLCWLFRCFLRSRFCLFLCDRLLRHFLGWFRSRLFCRFLRRSLLRSRSLLLRRLFAATTAGRTHRRWFSRWCRGVHFVILFPYQNRFFFLFFLFFQILFQRFAIGAAVTVFICLIVPTVQSRIIEAHISS